MHRGRGPRDFESNSSGHRESRELVLVDNRDRGRRFEAQPDPRDRMWTEITRDLVSEEAIKEKGYEYEETPEFYYVMEYLRYVSLPRSLSFSSAFSAQSISFSKIPPCLFKICIGLTRLRIQKEDVLSLVELTEEIKHDRRRRIRDIRDEREFLREERLPPRRPPALPQPWDEERVIEREVIYDGPRRYR